ncbi:MAG: 2-C-methyl-D-erythritol 4-phosphate cytidylyltransferase [Bacteroidetes bacterium]|jgi:2-C-methyl-D-erythritol 4-phosphate cytidylyltransferase|nr:2-C-methyl-D-erythritol 4-phosphate cytidylyltransferase [Bacteroidota bacterium]MCA6442368.1 2-C-methyl-D-erythritol 4-phosphate cytidylyltransferase [Bacteroidota bacterium]
MSKRYAIIVAGGTGSRMKSQIPKQFLEINGVPVIVKTMQQFLYFDSKIEMIISVHKDYMTLMNDLIQLYFSSYQIKIVGGGATRFQSVKNGLTLIEYLSAVVAIHDAARPYVSIETIERCYKTAEQLGNAVPVIQVNESLRQVNGNINKAVNRNQFKIVQTPQCFKAELLQKAFLQTESDLFTDDASVVESYGISINLVEGNPENIKITTPADLKN